MKVLNDGGDFPSNAEVVIAPPSIFLQTVKDTIRSDIKVRDGMTYMRSDGVMSNGLRPDEIVNVLITRSLAAGVSHGCMDVPGISLMVMYAGGHLPQKG